MQFQRADLYQISVITTDGPNRAVRWLSDVLDRVELGRTGYPMQPSLPAYCETGGPALRRTCGLAGALAL